MDYSNSILLIIDTIVNGGIQTLDKTYINTLEQKDKSLHLGQKVNTFYNFTECNTPSYYTLEQSDFNSENVKLKLVNVRIESENYKKQF